MQGDRFRRKLDGEPHGMVDKVVCFGQAEDCQKEKLRKYRRPPSVVSVLGAIN